MTADPQTSGGLFEWLVPEGGELESRAVRVTQFARALQAQAASASEIDPELAREELRARGVAQAGAALEQLLRLHLSSHLAGASFAWFGGCDGSAQDAWRALENLREEGPPLPGVPEPDEPSLDVAARLLDGLYRWGWDAERLELWRARVELASGGARRGEAAFRQRLERVEPTPARAQERCELLAGLVECLLDRGALREARLLLADHQALVRGHARLAQLEVWGFVLAGELEQARKLSSSLTPWDGALPEALVDLRASWPQALRWLSGRASSHSASGSGQWRQVQVEPADRPTTRTEFGASVFAVFAFGPGRSVEALLVDAAPALRGRVDEWLFEREGACTVASLPEHELVLSAGPCIAHGTPPSGALDPRAVARALVPVLDHEGEVTGWLHLECDHHLLPSLARLARFAAAWRPAILRRGRFAHVTEFQGADRVRESRPSVDGWNRVDAEDRLAQRVPERDEPFVSEVYEALVEALDLGCSRRRWWAFRARNTSGGGGLEFATCGGDAREEADPTWGGARALERALATGGVVQFDEPDAGLSLDASSASGFVLPISADGERVGLLAVESERRRDFNASELAACNELAQSFALPLELAGLRAWHHECFGHDLYFDAGSEGFAEFAREVRAAGASTSPVMLSGPRGVGKTIVARWLHGLRAGESQGLEVLDAAVERAQPGAAERLAAKLNEARDGGLLIESVCDLDLESQGVLLGALEGGGRGAAPALYITSAIAASEAVEQGVLRADLAQRLDRLQLRIPALADRREELPGWVRFLSRRFALEEGRAAPSFDDAALAALWRQPWSGNLRDLESFVFKLVLLHAGGEVGLAEVHDVAARYKVPLLKKLPSRHPRNADLVAALRSTFKAGTHINKRRAALYLGWDPDTLVSRLKDAKLVEEELGAEPLAWRR